MYELHDRYAYQLQENNCKKLQVAQNNSLAFPNFGVSREYFMRILCSIKSISIIVLNSLTSFSVLGKRPLNINQIHMELKRIFLILDFYILW